MSGAVPAVTVERERCIGAGQCVLAAPDLFDQDDDGTVVVLDADPPGELREAAREAADVCPARVITVR